MIIVQVAVFALGMLRVFNHVLVIQYILQSQVLVVVEALKLLMMWFPF